MAPKSQKTARKPRSVRENSLPPSERFALTINASADALGIGRTKIYEMIASGDLQTLKIGGRRLIPRASIEALIQRAQ